MRKPVPTEPTAKLPLTVEQYSSEKKLPLDYLTKEWGLKNVQRGSVCCVEQPYTRMDGEVCAPRYRYANAKQSPYNSGDHIILYGQKQLISLEGSTCILVEGESDTQTLHYARYNVLGIPGTSMWSKCLANDPEIVTFLAWPRSSMHYRGFSCSTWARISRSSGSSLQVSMAMANRSRVSRSSPRTSQRRSAPSGRTALASSLATAAAAPSLSSWRDNSCRMARTSAFSLCSAAVIRPRYNSCRDYGGSSRSRCGAPRVYQREIAPAQGAV